MTGFGLLRRLRPTDDRAFGATAEKLRRQGQVERAVEVCRDGLEKHPDQLSARVTLGWALIDLGRYDEARPELEYVLRRAPDNLLAIRGMAHLHDHIETASVLSMEQLGDWPPRPEDIERAVAEPAGGAPVEPVALAFEEPAWTEAPAVEPVPPTAAAAELLEESEALDALADVAEVAAVVEEPIDEPLEVKLDSAAELNLEAIATELTAEEPATPSPEPVELGGDVIDALQDLLERAQLRRDEVSKDSAA